jgi:hypothetical protein
VSKKLDVLAQVVLKQGSDQERRTLTVSDQTVVETARHTLKVGFSTATETVRVQVGGALSVKSRWLLVSTDRIVRVQFVTVHSSTDLTTKVGYGDEINANGFYLCNLTGGVTNVWLTNRAATTATVEVALFATTSV